MSLVAMSPLLRRVLVADALISAAAGIMMVAGANLLQGLLQLPYSLLMGAGLALFPWTAGLLWLAVWTVIVLNVVWVADSAWVAFGGSYTPNTLGLAFIGLQAVMVAVLAELEFTGLRRAAPVFAAA